MKTDTISDSEIDSHYHCDFYGELEKIMALFAMCGLTKEVVSNLFEFVGVVDGQWVVNNRTFLASSYLGIIEKYADKVNVYFFAWIGAGYNGKSSMITNIPKAEIDYIYPTERLFSSKKRILSLFSRAS